MCVQESSKTVQTRAEAITKNTTGQFFVITSYTVRHLNDYWVFDFQLIEPSQMKVSLGWIKFSLLLFP